MNPTQRTNPAWSILDVRAVRSVSGGPRPPPNLKVGRRTTHLFTQSWLTNGNDWSLRWRRRLALQEHHRVDTAADCHDFRQNLCSSAIARYMDHGRHDRHVSVVTAGKPNPDHGPLTIPRPVAVLGMQA
jgi:hypothetical protein